MNTKMQKIERKLSVISYISRARLGKLVCQMIEEVKKIYHQGCFPGGVAIYGQPANGVTLPTTNLEGETEVKDQVWRYLMGDEVGMIGVRGMGGIGKTTIMKHSNNQLLKETLFDKVIWITVSKELNILNLQGAIARAMNQFLPEDVLE
ncbi:probable disease resistance protein At5g63020 [Herrania umbratica]|uniref:Probable disease resistance protein At5g63020 n=1 Tax=Herrania umbratica TaxID=108875 RepID=A0A6J1AM85_9ROSI|nr:probable disease resistance protein At5g63020 [Herrania umbratica]